MVHYCVSSNNLVLEVDTSSKSTQTFLIGDTTMLFIDEWDTNMLFIDDYIII